jgi:hypothetical protein
MTRCVSERALMRLEAGGGTDQQRAHVDTCLACAGRNRLLRRDLERISAVLLGTDEPRAPAGAHGRVARTRLWVPAGAAAGLVALLVWAQLATRPPAVPVPLRGEDAMAVLEDVSLTMFSVDGRLAAPIPEALADTPERGADCDWPDWSATVGCGEAMDPLPSLLEPVDYDL